MVARQYITADVAAWLFSNYYIGWLRRMLVCRGFSYVRLPRCCIKGTWLMYSAVITIVILIKGIACAHSLSLQCYGMPFLGSFLSSILHACIGTCTVPRFHYIFLCPAIKYIPCTSLSYRKVFHAVRGSEPVLPMPSAITPDGHINLAATVTLLTVPLRSSYHSFFYLSDSDVLMTA